MKIYAHNFDDKVIIDEFLGTDYWVRCYIHHCHSSSGNYCHVNNDYNWVKFLKVDGLFYTVQICTYFMLDDDIILGQDDFDHITQYLYTVELGDIRVKEPMEIITTEDLFPDMW